MEQSNTYVYACQPRQRSPSVASSKSGGTYQNSSAFSASANPDEDWTKISDLAERRRIQNRIAQKRNYRKKLKRRLEDLERRTTSSSASPEQPHRELSKDMSSETGESEQIRRRASAPRAGIMLQEQQQQCVDLMSLEDAWMSQAPNTKTTFPFSTPSTYSFPESYPSTAEYFPDQFQSLSYDRLPMTFTSSNFAPECAPSISPAMPSMMPSDNYKVGQQEAGIDLLTPFNLNYSSLAGFNVSTPDGSAYTSRNRNAQLTAFVTPPPLAHTYPDGSAPQVPCQLDANANLPQETAWLGNLEVDQVRKPS